VAQSKHLREWLFHSRSEVVVGVRNSSVVGSGVGMGEGANNLLVVNLGVGMGVGANNLLGVNLGAYFYCLNVALALFSNTLVCMVIYCTDVYTMYI
jgi:hypothetical protein